MLDTLGKIVKLYFTRSFALNEKLNVHPGQVALLQMLEQQEGVSQKELAKCIMVKPSTITVMLNRMEERGFIKKVPHQTDHRKICIYLTKEGKDVVQKVKENTMVIEEELLKGFSKEEKEQVFSYFQRMKGNLLETVGEFQLPKMVQLPEIEHSDIRCNTKKND